jgi:hypothetical protein
MSPDSPAPYPESTVQAQAMFEISVALSRFIAMEGCTLATGSAVFDVVTQLFAETVGKGLALKPRIWNEAGQTYVFKQIKKIALCACSVAKDTNQSVVSAPILEDCAKERIALEMENCSYAARMAERIPAWSKVPWGDFCPTGIG